MKPCNSSRTVSCKQRLTRLQCCLVQLSNVTTLNIFICFELTELDADLECIVLPDR